MAKIYANRIMTSHGAYTLEDVPGYIRDDVRAILIERGFIKEDGKEESEVE